MCLRGGEMERFIGSCQVVESDCLIRKDMDVGISTDLIFCGRCKNLYKIFKSLN